MSLRFDFPTTALDGRVHREEELSLARIASQASHASQSSQRGNAKPAVPRTPDGAAAAPAMGSVPSPSPPAPNRRRVALPDPVALKFLEGEQSVALVERRHVLPGYELYLVEQWACSRQSPTLVIATYTGDPKHSIVVGVLDIPADEKAWSPRLRVYFRAIHQYHARPKDTDVGELMVTNLSGFPSALTVIPVPEGDIRKHRQVFIVNEDLKRLGCSGRSGLTLTEPTAATQAKFMQLYKTSDRIPFTQAVVELVRLCQLALFIFGMLEEEYTDGLLCDVTEKAINDWWTEIGSEYFNIEPTDGILGPTTVAALLGTLLGARNRLSYYGAPVAKDVFDMESTKKGIGTFQKSMRLERTRRLDRQTLLKLHSVTAKAAAGEGGWGVQKAVKSTVAEIGGKRGELVIGMVSGGRDKANIGDIETLDLARFISLAHGERSKWLWYGKPRRTPQDHHQHEHLVSAFGRELREEHHATRRTQSAPVEEEEPEIRRKEESPAVLHAPPQATQSMPIAAEVPGGDRDALRKTVFKSVAGKVNDARSGLGRIRDAVGTGLRGHVSRPSKDETPDTAMSSYSSPSIAALAQTSANVTSPVAVGRAFTWKVKPEEYLPTLKDHHEEGEPSAALPRPGGDRIDEQQQLSTARDAMRTSDAALEEKERLETRLLEMAKSVRSTTVSAPGSVVADEDLQGPVLALERNADGPLLALQRRHSVACIASLRRQPSEARYPRRLSFSAAEEAVLYWDELISLGDALPPPPTIVPTTTTVTDPTTTTTTHLHPHPHPHTELSHHLYAHLQSLHTDLLPYVSARVADVSALEASLTAQQASAHNLHTDAEESYLRARHRAAEILADERARLGEAVKDVEGLAAKLEYEVGALVGRVGEVEEGVAQFEGQVREVEGRAEELRGVLFEREGWVGWVVRRLTGVGSAGAG